VAQADLEAVSRKRPGLKSAGSKWTRLNSARLNQARPNLARLKTGQPRPGKTLNPASAKLTFFIPGLCGAREWLGNLELPRLPSLQLMFARGSVTTHRAGSSEQQLLELNGYSGKAELPVAGLTALVDLPGSNVAAWLRADPVYLRADMSKLLLFDATTFALEMDEAASLIADINANIAEIVVCLGENPGRWYIALTENAALDTWPPSSVAARSSFEPLPDGTDAQRWREISNEVQMILHASSVNQARQERGLPPVNSFWLWGAGELLPFKSSFDVLISKAPNDALAPGIAQHCGIDWRELPGDGNGEHLVVTGNMLLVLEDLALPARYANAEQWLRCLEQVESRWIAWALTALKGNKLGAVEIYSDELRIQTTRGNLRRWWRRTRPLTESLSEPQHLSRTP